MSIKVEQLTKFFGEQTAVNKLSFEVSTGNIVGFLGPNGAGKSTTMKMLTTYIPPTSGTASICGIDIIQNPIEVRKIIGYLPESNPLYYDLYIREYLEIVAGIHQLGNKTKARIDEIIEMTGLTKEIKKKIGNISKGYKQRVGLAQAMIHDPKVLILDEPTSGLDPNQIIEIRDLILNIGKTKTVLLSTHIMQEVEAMCNKVIIINNGNIVANDDIGNIHQTETTEEMVRIESLVVAFSQPIDVLQLANIILHEIETIAHATYKIPSEDIVALKKQLMTWALTNDKEITAINTEVHTLEDTFRKLTKK